MTAAIEIAGLTKVYGAVRALDGVTLTVPEGSVYGFLGPNGAGKTTTLRVLTGLARPTSGTARVFGNDVVRASTSVRADIGFLPDVPGYYAWMNAEEFLRFSGQLFGFRGGDLDARVNSLLDLAGLAGVETKVGGYSRGMKQRLGVAQALINAPKLLMLDEPTSALDPMGRKDVLDMILALKDRTTVFFSTHILSDVERVCDTVAILDKGRVVREAPIHELKHSGAATRVQVEISDRPEEVLSKFADAPWSGECTREGRTITCVIGDLAEARREIPRTIADLGASMVRMAELEPTLEDVFVELVGGEA